MSEYFVCVDGIDAVACSCGMSFVVGPFSTREKAIKFQEKSWDDCSIVLEKKEAQDWLLNQMIEYARKDYGKDLD